MATWIRGGSMRQGGLLGLAGSMTVLLSCTPQAFFNNTAPLGGTTPGARGDIAVSFINNTPYRAVFTFGTYDPQNVSQTNPDPNLPTLFAIKFNQFSVGTDVNQLNAKTSSQVFSFQQLSSVSGDPGGCGRAMSIGGGQLVQLIEDNRTTLESRGQTILDESLKPICDPAAQQTRAGVAFYKETSPKPAANACESTEQAVAWAEGVVTLQGVDYPCDSLLVYTFDVDPNQADRVTIALTAVIPQ